MARLDFVDPTAMSATDAATVERIRSRRGGQLRPLDLMLLNSPPLADGWNSLLAAVRQESIVDADIRELAILRVAALNQATYEWQAHEPHGRAAGLNYRALEAAAGTTGRDGLNRRQQTVLEYTDAMTLHVRVPDRTFSALRAQFTDREVLEITLIIATYNLVSRFLVALEIDA